MKVSRHIFLLPLCFFFLTISAYAQTGFKVDIEKPAPYTERKLKAEKTGEGKLKAPKRIMQNLTTRFNYYFNANNKFNEVLERAKEQHKDDYSQLLSFYNYDLNATAADSAQLDSVIYKARTGITNHDLRNEWIDELYLLWATSWHLEQKFDSASLMLQFINYAYAPQYEDGFYKHIGTNADGARELSIVTKEEKKFLHSNTFSRNNAFLWQIRTLIEMGDMTGAGSLITTLKRDPAFPKRLQNSLDEAEAYWHYRQQRWDSAAVHLLATLDGDYPRVEKARWRYLAAQMLERAGKTTEAVDLYQKVVSATPDPVMEVYARLNTVRLSKEGGKDATDKNLAELLKMARRDKYEDYRDIIYFMAAQLELERGNITAASDLLIKGSKFNTGDQSSKNKTFLKIADVSWEQKKYLQAASFYDSIEVLNLAEEDAARVTLRKAALKNVVLNSSVVDRQDSLQRIAALPEEERKEFVKKLVKKLRKQQGLKEEPASLSGGATSPLAAATNPPADLFSQQKGEWYFYNNNAKAQGAAQFKAVWGNRPNVDNWRRFAVVSQQQASLTQPDQLLDVPGPNSQANTGITAGNELSVEGLTSRLPLTPEAITASNDSIQKALFGLGTAYLNEVDDLPMAIATFEELRRRFPDMEKGDEVLFNLSYAYNKTGNATAAAEAKRQLTANFPSSRFATIVSTGKDPVVKNNAASPEATKAYENVYNLFIEGRFADAENAKRIADSTYKTTFWQPQLLYIESVYYIRQRQDSIAKTILQTIVQQNSHKGLTQKAQNLMNVLGRRQQIEDELRNLQLTRPEEDTAASQPALAQVTPVTKDTAAAQKDTVVLVKAPVADLAKDSAALAKIRQKQVSDSIAQSNLLAKKLRDSLETVRRDSLALAKKQADEARKDSLARVALAAKEKADSLALAKQQADEARRDSLAKKAWADKQRADSLITVRRDSIARVALAAQQRRDSIAQAKAALEQARKDSIALRQALAKQAKDSTAMRNYLEQKQRDSLARITRDSLALVKKQVDEARRDSLARKALADKQRSDSIALAKQLAAEARKDSLARKAIANKQRADSLAAARKDSLAQLALAAQLRRDSISEAKAAREQARKDSLAQAQILLKQQRDSIALARQTAQRLRDSMEAARRDSLAQIKPSVVKPVADPNAYFFEPEKPHYGIVILDKVDPIFVGEARNAFSRYNKENYGSQPLDVQIISLTDDIRMLVVSGLPTAEVATDYITKAKTLSATEIIPWLTGNKYTFSIISARNLELLKAKSDLPAYKKFLEQHLPGKF